MEETKYSTKNDIKTRSYNFAVKIVGFIDSFDKKDFIAQTLLKQLLRSGTSIGTNIMEAQAGGTKRDFTNFYYYALKSANETKFWLSLLYDTKVNNSEIKGLIKEVQEIQIF